jgi:hypothetical protein
MYGASARQKKKKKKKNRNQSKICTLCLQKMHKQNLAPCCDDFDQRKSLLPLPFPKHYHLASLVDGVRIGDKLFDELSMRDLLAVVRSGRCEALEATPIPEWVDRKAIARGQAFHISKMLSFLVSLTGGKSTSYAESRRRLHTDRSCSKGREYF